MEISRILRADAVKLVGSTSSKKRLLQELAEIAASAYGIDTQQAAEALLERESLGPTGVGNGIALPHARLDGIDRVIGVFLRLERPVEFDAVDRQPVDLVFALFAPESSGVEHLKALAVVSRTMRDANICAKLRSNEDVAALYAVLTEVRASEAA